MLRLRPSMIDTIAMIVVMPMMTPRTVRNERSLFVRMAPSAMVTPSPISMAIPLLLPKRDDRVEACGARRRIDAEEEPHRGRHSQADRHRPRLDRGGKGRRGANGEGDGNSERDA